MGSTPFASGAEREHVRMLEQEQKIGYATCAPLFDERLLKRQAVGVAHASKPTDFQVTRRRDRSSPECV
jgi:hypothetical protein